MPMDARAEGSPENEADAFIRRDRARRYAERAARRRTTAAPKAATRAAAAAKDNGDETGESSARARTRSATRAAWRKRKAAAKEAAKNAVKPASPSNNAEERLEDGNGAAEERPEDGKELIVIKKMKQFNRRDLDPKIHRIAVYPKVRPSYGRKIAEYAKDNGFEIWGAGKRSKDSNN